jgi:drug/metabolite transporter (DMT)-like permease
MPFWLLLLAWAFLGERLRGAQRLAVVVKRLQKRRQVDLLSLTTWQMLFGSLPLILIAALTWHAGPDWSAPFVWALVCNVILGNALAWFLWLYASRKLSAGAAGIGTPATPVIGVTATRLQLGERPTAGEAGVRAAQP